MATGDEFPTNATSLVSDPSAEGLNGSLTQLGELFKEPQGRNGSMPSTNQTDMSDNGTCRGGITCIDGLLLPLWHATPPEAPLGDRILFAVIFILCIVYIFIGIGMVSEVFAGAIEKITSQKRRKKVRSDTEPDKFEYIEVPVWNPVVAQLTLGAIGSSAAEILLNFIDTCTHFQPGELGPGTIVGAGAYNLFIIQAICIASVKNGKSKRIRDLRIYFVTAIYALFAYFWLYVIMVPSSPGVVEVWEALMTMVFYVLMVLTGYAVDTNLFGLFSKARRSIAPTNPDQEMSSSNSTPVPSFISPKDPAVERSRQHAELVEQRYLAILEQIRSKSPNVNSEEVQRLAAVQLLNEMPKSRGYYRMQTSRGITGGGDVISAEKLQTIMENREKERAQRERTSMQTTQLIAFDPDVYQVSENAGFFDVHVTRCGAGIDETAVTVVYTTKEGTAKADIDFYAMSGTLVFDKGERLKTIPIRLIDDEEFTNDCEFFVQLSNAKFIAQPSFGHGLKLKLSEKSFATIKKMDDDQGGCFHFGNDQARIEENCGEAELKILRSSGVKGRVEVPFRVTPITALPYVHYEIKEPPAQKVLIFEARQTEQSIKLKIKNEGKLKKEKIFKIELCEPQWSSKQLQSPSKRDVAQQASDDQEAEIDVLKLGRPRLDSPSTLTVTICESRQLRATLDEIVAVSDNVGELVASKTWREQFSSAVTVRGDVDADTGTEMEPRPKNYLVHFSLFFWKLWFATIPPVHIAKGWLSFLVCLLYIGLMAAVLGDLAKQLGCTIGLRNKITAITFVALGSSLPDMFAARLAAIKEETADSAIGGANGAVALNVYMGLGLSWSVAAIYQYAHGRHLEVPPGSLTFSFTVFLSFAAVCIVVVLMRRLAPVHGELGGPPVIKFCTVALLVLLWAGYVILSALDNYCTISTF